MMSWVYHAREGVYTDGSDDVDLFTQRQILTIVLHWKLHIVTAALQNYKFVENLWEIYVSLLAVYVTLQQPQKV